MVSIRKAQGSVEYLLTIGIVLLILLGAFGAYWYYHRLSSKEIENTRVKLMGNQIVDTVKLLSASGGYSVKKLNFDVPDSVQGVFVSGGYGTELVINVSSQGGIDGIPFFSNVKMVDMINKSESPSVIYVIKNYGEILLASHPDASCTVGSCCSSGLCGLFPDAICTAGQLTCRVGIADMCIGEVLPGTEVCSEWDDDCDGSKNEGFTEEDCRYVCNDAGWNWTGTGGTLNCCGNGPYGNPTREPRPWQGEYEVIEKTMDNRDNDCDGIIDEFLSCRTATSSAICEEGDKEFGIISYQNSTGGEYNAHVQNYTNNTLDPGRYANSVCCKSNANLTVFNVTPGEPCQAYIAETSRVDNAHVAFADASSSYFPNKLCANLSVGNIECMHLAGDCPADYGCLFTYENPIGIPSDRVNAHVANCSAASRYKYSVCCVMR